MFKNNKWNQAGRGKKISSNLELKEESLHDIGIAFMQLPRHRDSRFKSVSVAWFIKIISVDDFN